MASEMKLIFASVLLAVFGVIINKLIPEIPPFDVPLTLFNNDDVSYNNALIYETMS